VFAVAAGIAVSALALVPQGAAVISGDWKTIEQESLGFSLVASGAIGMRIGNVLRGPDTP
jgi:hypothetical protein